jgi:hypothetical protein
LGPLDGPLRLTLLALLLQPVGDWRVRPLATALAALGLLLPRALRSPWVWAALATLAGTRVVLDWPMADNHAYLLCWWTLAIAIALSSAEPPGLLATNARLLIGLVFVFATLWKAVLSPDFLDTRFLRVQMVTDDRLAPVATAIARLAPDELRALRTYVSQHTDGPAAAADPPPQPDRFRRTATLATWTVVALEALLALAFLVPPGWRLARRRDGLLLLFALGTYVAVAPVEGFGWLLLALGAAQADRTRAWVSPAYAAAFVALILSRGLIWMG